MVLGFYAVSMLPLVLTRPPSPSRSPCSRCWWPSDRRREGALAALGATIVGFVGVLVMVQPGQGGLQLGALVALANAATVALSILLVKRLSDSETPLMILTQFAIFSTLLLALPAKSGCGAGPVLRGWVLAIGIALSATVGQYFLGQAFRGGRNVGSGAVQYLRLPFAVFVGWLIWGEMPIIWTYVGAAIVIASALYIAHREAQLSRGRRRAEMLKPPQTPAS